MRAAAAERRATQSLIGTIQYCLRHPSLLAIELSWRWLFGIPALWLLVYQGLRIWALIPPETLARLQAAAYDPVQASAILLVLGESLLPVVTQIATWIAPTLIAAWAVVSGVGRWLVLRRLGRLRPEFVSAASAAKIIPLIAFQAARMAGLAAAFVTGFVCIRRAAAVAFQDLQNPNLVLYATVVIVSVLGLFTVWALVSWLVNLAPLLLVREDLSVATAVRRSAGIGRVMTGKLMEVNLVLGIVKLALLVLAMVFSAIPLPFESVTTPQQLHVWWAIVSVAYLIANAFFQVVRVVSTLESLTRHGRGARPVTRLFRL